MSPDHFYRHLEATLDLSFVRDWKRELYAARGRPSIDPVVFLKLQLLMFFEGIRSERKLVETANLNVAHVWYLGSALNEALPDHSSLTRTRQAKEWHGLRRLRLRRLVNANIQGLLIATGWGRRHAPCGRLAALPKDPWTPGAAFT